MKNEPQIEILKTNTLIPYAKNSRTHSAAQVSQIAGSIKEFGFTNPVLIDAENGIIAGHGRVMAAQKLGMLNVPCIRLSYLTETQRKAYVIADNKLALNAEWDENMLALELSDLRELNFDLGLLGFDAEEIELALNPPEPEVEEFDDYNKKVDAPIYEPKGEMPPIAELCNAEKSNELVKKIASSKATDEIKAFLKQAAQRHVIFDYSKIAEFYCHADKETQELMEESALIIIDFNKAMQLGYVKLKEEITDALAKEEGTAQEDDVL